MSILLRKLNNLKLIWAPRKNIPHITQFASIISSHKFIVSLSNKNIFERPTLNYWSKSYQQRFKSKQKKLASDDENDYTPMDDDSSLSRDSKLVKFSTTSMRTDGILKNALGIARNKIEKYFYESRIRVNGRKILKKSVPVKEGDEIDVIKAVSLKNPDHLQVARVEIINVVAQEESISISARRFKNLLIENYEHDPFKGTIEDDGKN